MSLLFFYCIIGIVNFTKYRLESELYYNNDRHTHYKGETYNPACYMQPIICQRNWASLVEYRQR